MPSPNTHNPNLDHSNYRFHKRDLIKHSSPFSKAHILVVALIFGAIGGYILITSLAAPNPNLQGDLNNDNTVNISDLSILLTNYGTTNTVADINHDNLVNITDLSILLSHYGSNYVPPTTSCTKYAATNGSDSNSGTLTLPYLTPQKLVDNLSAGDVGCMRGGTYNITTLTGGVGVFITRTGTSGFPITLTSYPGERATVTSSLAIPEVILVHEGADNITLSNFNVVATDPIASNAKLAGKNLVVSGMDFTTNNTGNNCLYFGDGAAIVENAHIFNNRLHECGNPIHDNQDHCIYAHTLLGGYIKNNFMYNCSGYAIQFYPASNGVLFDHNTIDGGVVSVRGGVVFGSDPGWSASSNNIVTNNVITYAATYGVTTAWGNGVGTGNQANDNCLWSADIDTQTGFTATGNITASVDPFNNRAAGDYSIKAGSVCAGKGAL